VSSIESRLCSAQSVFVLFMVLTCFVCNLLHWKILAENEGKLIKKNAVIVILILC
jgi:hypothetical protein